MKDQNTIDAGETKKEKWARAHSLFLESLYKADHELRGCSHNQKCYNELMEIRELVIDIVKDMKNPYTPPLKSGEKNKIKVPSYNGISLTLLRGALGKHYMKDWTEEQIEEYNKIKGDE